MSEIDTAAPAPEVPAAPVAAPIATPPPDSTAEQVEVPEGESPESKPERTFTQKELDEIVQKRLGKESRRAERLAEARIRAEYAERQLAELKAPPKPESPSGEPKPDQFQDYETYIAALTDWKVDQKLGGIRKESEAQQRKREAEEMTVKQLPKIERGREKYEDFDEVVRDFVAQVPPAMHDAILESEVTDQLLYFLGQNPAERDRIFRLSNVGQVKAIAALETKLTTVPTPTKTPPPIVPNSTKAPVTKDLSQMDYKDFVKARRAQIAARR